MALIARSDLFPRRNLLLGYLKIKLLGAIRYYNTNEINQIRLLGFTINFYNTKLLLSMFRDIFLRKDYFIRNPIANPLIIDCGANIGVSTIFFKMLYPKSRIIAFEPDKLAFKCLRENIKSNNLENVGLFNNIVYDKKDKIKFYIDPGNPTSLTMSTIKGRSTQAFEEIDSVILSEHINEMVDFLKMDIEGAEDLVIIEIANQGKLRLINEMVIEYHHHINLKEDKFSKILKVLEDNGFGYQISSSSRQIIQRETSQDILIYAYKK
jgi:FkbM family methyltransferase